MDIKRRRHYFGDMLTEEQLTRTELPEIEDGIIKYIDCDIDIKSYANGEFNVIDWADFKESIKKLNYPFELIHRLYDELDYLYEQFKTKNGIFSKILIEELQEMLIESGDI